MRSKALTGLGALAIHAIKGSGHAAVNLTGFDELVEPDDRLPIQVRGGPHDGKWCMFRRVVEGETPDCLAQEYGRIRGWVFDHEMTPLEIAKCKPVVAGGSNG